ncbi:MAG: iron-sulfur cluster assembly accessory protein [Chloroflexi bacterium]|nr:iron-sulfur cluster assembly accessory protein [Chloroflexota bacterium]
MTNDTERSDLEQPSLSFTAAAAEKLSEVIGGHPNPVAGLRLQIIGRQRSEFQHILSLVEEGAQIEDDIVVDTTDGIRVYVERRNVRYLDRVEIHYENKGPSRSGLEFTNPNPLWFDEKEEAIQRIFDEEINPAIAAHGGVVNLLGVEGDTAYVEFGGGCQGCGMVAVTLKQGVEVAVKEQVPGIERIVDSTDHQSGENPYYKPSKK